MWQGLALSDNALRRFQFTIWGNRLEIYDRAASGAAFAIAQELKRDDYGLAKVRLNLGDCVVDIGAHVGLFSIALALRFPFLRIHAYEPYPPNRELLERNLALNGVTQVTVHPEALTGDARTIEMGTNPTNSGGASAFAGTLQYGRIPGIPSIRLDDLFQRHGIAQCAVLKIDCEGAEYEVLHAATIWNRTGILCGEFHSNAYLDSLGHTPEKLIQYCGQRLAPRDVRVTQCHMSE